MISVNDIVNVTLNGGGVLTNVIVRDVPKKNEIYWTLETDDGVTWVVGPSLVAIRKI